MAFLCQVIAHCFVMLVRTFFVLSTFFVGGLSTELTFLLRISFQILLVLNYLFQQLLFAMILVSFVTRRTIKCYLIDEVSSVGTDMFEYLFK